MIKIIKKDLFKLKDYPLAHCISADWGMGAGIAVTFQKKYKVKNHLYKYYPQLLGKYPTTIGIISKDRFIFNLVTKNKYWNKPSLSDLEKCIIELKILMDKVKIKKIAMPKIGCGLDRLNWDDVKEILEKTFDDSYEIIICYI